MERSRRVAVTSPQTRLAHARGRARGRWRVARLDAGDAERAEVHYRRQRIQAGLALLGVALVVPGLPLLLWARPDLDGLLLSGIPVSWLALGVLPYPAMAAIGFWQLYRSEHIERAPTAPEPAAAPAPGAPHTGQHRLRIAVRVRRRPAGPAHAPFTASPPGAPAAEIAEAAQDDQESGEAAGRRGLQQPEGRDGELAGTSAAEPPAGATASRAKEPSQDDAPRSGENADPDGKGAVSGAAPHAEPPGGNPPGAGGAPERESGGADGQGDR